MSEASTRAAVRTSRLKISGQLCLVVGTTVAICAALLAGCTRTHYRTQADALASDIVGGGTVNPRFQLQNFGIAIDPRSRLYDSTNLDFPPMPPDDPDAARLMVCVDGHKGWPHWKRDGVLDDVEVSDYRSSLPYDADGKIRIDQRGAMQLSRLHSRDYQAQLESMYLSALDVTAQRFQFQTQFYTASPAVPGNLTQYLGEGPGVSGGPWTNIYTMQNDLQMSRTFVTGATLVTNIANSIVWQFSDNRITTNSGLLNFAFSQPLLQFAGRPFFMELLTRAERGLLGNLRQYDRYRQGFYLTVALGQNNPTTVGRIGGLFGGSGLVDFSGVGVGGFGGLGAVSNLVVGANAGNAGIAPGGAGGLWYFLQQQQNLRNIRSQTSRLRDTWLQLSAAFDAGRLENRFQVDFARQAYYIGQSTLLQQVNQYDNFLDLYKVTTLGLPPDTPIEIRDPFFEQFNLLDPDLTELEDEIGDRLEELSKAHVEGTALPNDKPIKNISPRVQQFIDKTTQDLAQLDKILPERRQALIDLTEFPELKESHFDNRALTPESLDDQVALLKREFPRISDDLANLTGLFDKLQSETEFEPAEMIRVERELLTRLTSSLLELSLLQARARLHGISLVPVRIRPELAFQVALTRRADWMNTKASLVDAWRLIRYNASGLKSMMSVNVSGALGTIGNNPVQFNAQNGTLTAGLTFTPPLTRVIERNTFRQSLIDYQQTRRAVMLYRDSMHQSLRVRLRQVRLDQLNLELRRLAVDVAITQTDVARLKLIEPEKPVTDSKAAAAATSPTLARDLVDALTNLVNSQQALFFVWGDYEIVRRLIDFELGTMQLDENGMWIDSGPLTNERLLELYYESFCDPFNPEKGPPPLFATDQAGHAELGPTELPPEGDEMELLFPEALPKPQ